MSNKYSEKEVPELRSIPGYDGYKASSDGYIWSFTGRSGKPCIKLVAGIKKDGYATVALYRDKKMKRFRVCRLVCMAFHGMPSEGQVTRHNDGSRYNDAAANLAWGTVSDNANDAVRHGTHPGLMCNRSKDRDLKTSITRKRLFKEGKLNVPRGEANGLSKHTEQQIRSIKTESALGISNKILSDKYGVPAKYITCILAGKVWKHV